MENKTEKKEKTISIKGFYPKALSGNIPDYIWGKGSIHIDKMIEFLNAHRPMSISGYLNYDILEGEKDGEKYRYGKLDLYRFNQQPEQVKQDAMIKLRNPNYPTPTEQGIDDLSKVGEPVPTVTAEDLDVSPDFINF